MLRDPNNQENKKPVLVLKENQYQDHLQNNEIINLTNIGLKKVNFDLETLEHSMVDLRNKVKDLTSKTPRVGEIFWSILFCDRSSKKIKIYRSTVKKISTFLDVSTIIKMMTEVQFLKKIIFSGTALNLFKCFTEIKSLNSEKVDEIHAIFKRLYENLHSMEQHDDKERQSKDMDVYMAEYFLQNAMENNK
jgi:hypothetical protein